MQQSPRGYGPGWRRSVILMLSLSLLAGAAAAGPWCPLWHDIYQPTMYDPSAPIR